MIYEYRNPGQSSEPAYHYAPEFRGMGLLSTDDLQSGTTIVGVGAAGGAIAQGLFSGAIIGGLAAGSMKAAGTGALLAGGLGGTIAGGALLLAAGMNPALRAGGIVGLVGGVVLLGFGATRSYRAIKGR